MLNVLKNMNNNMCTMFKKPSIKRIKIETPNVQQPVESEPMMNMKQSVRPQRKRVQEQVLDENKNTTYLSIYL